MTPSRPTTALTIAATALTAACTTTTTPSTDHAEQTPPPTPSTTATSTTAEQPALPHSGAPNITNPLPDTALPDDPCQALTPEQVQTALGNDAPTGERDNIATGPWCSWQDTNTGAAIFINYVLATGEGLSATYQNTKPLAKIWNELEPIHGYPAVATQRTEDDTSCAIHIGLANHYSISVAVAPARERDNTESCTHAQQIAETVVENLTSQQETTP